MGKHTRPDHWCDGTAQACIYFCLKTKTDMKDAVQSMPEKDFLEINIGPKNEREKIDCVTLLGDTPEIGEKRCKRTPPNMVSTSTTLQFYLGRFNINALFRSYCLLESSALWCDRRVDALQSAKTCL